MHLMAGGFSAVYSACRRCTAWLGPAGPPRFPSCAVGRHTAFPFSGWPCLRASAALSSCATASSAAASDPLLLFAANLLSSALKMEIPPPGSRSDPSILMSQQISLALSGIGISLADASFAMSQQMLFCTLQSF